MMGTQVEHALNVQGQGRAREMRCEEITGTVFASGRCWVILIDSINPLETQFHPLEMGITIWT